MKLAVLAGVTLFAFITPAHPKCAEMALQISGRITDTKSAPLMHATVDVEWKEIGGLKVRKSSATTDARGQFRTSISFYPWRQAKWFWQSYRCNSPPPLLRYGVEAIGHITQTGTIQSKYDGTEINVSLKEVH